MWGRDREKERKRKSKEMRERGGESERETVCREKLWECKKVRENEGRKENRGKESREIVEKEVGL